MPPSNPQFSASAAFSVRPERSQVVLIGLVVASIISLLCGAILCAMDKPGWMFIAIAIALFVSVIWGWKRSQSDTDLLHSHPTTVALPDGSNLSTDSRLLGSQERVNGFVQVLEALALRKPLPEPSGLVAPDGALIPESKEDAVQIVSEINAKTQEMHQKILEQLRNRTRGRAVSQSANGSDVPPPIDG